MHSIKLGYGSISTSGPGDSMQIEALISAGVGPKRIFTDELSGAREAKERPGVKALMDYSREEDEIYFWRLDRMGRSVIDVLNTAIQAVRQPLQRLLRNPTKAAAPHGASMGPPDVTGILRADIQGARAGAEGCCAPPCRMLFRCCGGGKSQLGAKTLHSIG